MSENGSRLTKCRNPRSNPKCKGFISPIRLKAVPEASICVDCQEVEEQDPLFKKQNRIRLKALTFHAMAESEEYPNESQREDGGWIK